MPPYLIVPGWAGSGPDHWQTYWEHDLDGARRVEMPDWHVPRRAGWVDALDRAIRAVAAPPILIAHSLGCLAIAHWAAVAAAPVRGALLVAPPDLERPGCPAALLDFATAPRARLPFASRVVASDDDPYAALGRARQLANAWGAGFTVLAGRGHINAASGLGRWRDGHALLRGLVDGEPAREARLGS